MNLTNAAWDYQVSAHQIPSLQRNGAGVVLVIHDGGGSEANTLQASINLIRQAKGLGYQFMTIPQLLSSQDFAGTVAGPVQPSLNDRVGYLLYWGPHIAAGAATARRHALHDDIYRADNHLVDPVRLLGPVVQLPQASGLAPG